MSNILIVESPNDQHFIEALLTHWKLQNLKIDPPICGINDIQCLEKGLSLKELSRTLRNLKTELQDQDEKHIEKIGILIDLDQETVENRLKLVNAAIQEVFTTERAIAQVNDWIIVDIDAEVSVKISCYFMNVGGKGELETVLKAIKCRDSIHADCLTPWRSCIKNPLTDKAFDKFWISVYQRFDCCDKKERHRAEEKCSLKASLEKGAYDLDNPILQALKTFLINMSTPE